MSRDEIAVFYRTNAQSRVLEDTLVRAEIAYQVIGGTKFYERAEIKDAIAYLNLLANPQDAVAFTRVANSPRRGIGQTSLSRVLAPRQHDRRVAIWDAAAEPRGGARPGDRGGQGDRAASWTRWTSCASAREQRRRRSASCSRRCCSETGYLEALEAERTIEAQGRHREPRGARRGRARVRRAAPRRARTRSTSSCRQIALVADADTRRDDEGLVTLMTLHNAKGLEYPIVFIIGCEEGVFPHSRALDEGGLEEERRLCYVGDHARDARPHLTYARRRNVFGARDLRAAEPLPRRDPGRPASTAERRARLGGVRAATPSGSGDRGAARRSASGSAAPATADGAGASFRLGDDVVHAAFGEGVVTGVEPGGVVVVRFAGDGSERKLMAEYAPDRRER